MTERERVNELLSREVRADLGYVAPEPAPPSCSRGITVHPFLLMLWLRIPVWRVSPELHVPGRSPSAFIWRSFLWRADGGRRRHRPRPQEAQSVRGWRSFLPPTPSFFSSLPSPLPPPFSFLLELIRGFQMALGPWSVETGPGIPQREGGVSSLT